MKLFDQTHSGCQCIVGHPGDAGTGGSQPQRPDAYGPMGRSAARCKPQLKLTAEQTTLWNAAEAASQASRDAMKSGMEKDPHAVR